MHIARWIAACVSMRKTMNAIARARERERALMVCVLVWCAWRLVCKRQNAIGERIKKKNVEKRRNTHRIRSTFKMISVYENLAPKPKIRETEEGRIKKHTHKNTHTYTSDCTSIIHSWINHLIRVAWMRMRITCSLHLMKQHTESGLRVSLHVFVT